MSKILTTLLCFFMLIPPGLAQVPREDRSLYSQYFWNQVEENLRLEVEPQIQSLIARNRYRYPVVGGGYTDRRPANEAEDNDRRSKSFWHEVESRRDEINYYKNQAPPGDRVFRLRATLAENTRASYRSVMQIANILTPMSAGLSPNMSIDYAYTQGEIQDNIAIAQNDPRTAQALQALRRANQELLLAKQNFKSGNHMQGEAHLDRAKAHLEKGREAIKVLRKIVEAAIAAGQLISMVPKRGQRNPYRQNIVRNQNNTAPPFAPPIVRRNTKANVVPKSPYTAPTLLSTGYANLDRQLNQYAQTLRDQAIQQQSDPRLQATVTRNVSEKFTGIGLGLNEAKEQIKSGATKAFQAAVRKTDEFKRDPAGTMNDTAVASVQFGAKFAIATMGVLNTAAKDANAFDKLLKSSIVTASQNYSRLSQRDQGKVIGNFILWRQLFSNTTQFNSVASNAFNRATNALAPHTQQIQQRVKLLANASKNSYNSAKLKLNQLAANLGSRQQMIPAGAGGYGNVNPNAMFSVRKPIGTGGTSLPARGGSPNAIKLGARFGKVIADDLPLKEGWLLDGQRLSKGLKWPKGWRKPTQGTLLTSKGKLYFRPNEAARKKFGLGKDALIPFKKGVPDLKQFSIDGVNHTFKGTLTGTQSIDTRIYAERLAQKGWRGLKTQQSVLDEFSKNNLTPHHFSETKNGTHIFQIVDRGPHKHFGHTGPASILRNRP